MPSIALSALHILSHLVLREKVMLSAIVICILHKGKPSYRDVK